MFVLQYLVCYFIAIEINYYKPQRFGLPIITQQKTYVVEINGDQSRLTEEKHVPFFPGLHTNWRIFVSPFPNIRQWPYRIPHAFSSHFFYEQDSPCTIQARSQRCRWRDNYSWKYGSFQSAPKWCISVESTILTILLNTRIVSFKHTFFYFDMLSIERHDTLINS